MKTFSELLAAAKDVYSQIGNLAPAHIRHVVTPKQRDNLQDAIAAAEREAAELAEPIDDGVLDRLTAGIDKDDGMWCFGAVIRVRKLPHRSSHIYVLIIGGCDLTEVKDKGQLLSLLKGLGIEVVA